MGSHGDGPRGHRRTFGRRHRRRASRRRWFVGCSLLLGVIASAAALAIRIDDGRQNTASDGLSEQAAHGSTEDRTGLGGVDDLAGLDARATTTVYAYSVIPGGAESVEHLRRVIDADPVVATHYEHFDLHAARIVPLPATKLAYASYRIGERIYWTSKRLRIPKGEFVITDGSHLARTRCGNQLSDTPMMAISTDEPSEAILDSPVLPAFLFGLTIPPLPASGEPIAGIPTLLGGAGGLGALNGGAGSPLPILTQSDPPPAIGQPPEQMIESPVPDPSLLIPGEIPGFPPSTGMPGMNITPSSPDIPNDPGTPEQPPVDPVPVIPEPATLVLVGLGIAGVIACRRRLGIADRSSSCI